jgi:hypothetical protein
MRSSLTAAGAFLTVSLLCPLGAGEPPEGWPECEPRTLEGCGCRYFPVEGTVVYVPQDGLARPLGGVKFYTADGERDKRRKVWTVSNDSGAFRFNATVDPGDEEWCEEGARLTFLLRARKCDERTLLVTPDWRPKTIEMTCPGRK